MDDVDRHIIDHLRANARAAYGEIGEEVDLSASAIKRRVDKLVAEGVIVGFTIDVDPFTDQPPTEAYVEIYCRGNVPTDELKQVLAAVPEVVYAGTITGAADALVHMVASDIPTLERAIERIREAPHVDHTETAIMLTPLTRRRDRGLR